MLRNSFAYFRDRPTQLEAHAPADRSTPLAVGVDHAKIHQATALEQ